MSRESKSVIQCDACGKRVTWNTEQLFTSGHPSQGWYTLKRVNMFKHVKEPTEWDFCSLDCLQIHAKKAPIG